MVAYQERHEFHGLKHMAIPMFGAIANLACMAFYIIGPIEGLGSVKERFRSSILA
jgi:basic amino acid/polyamine antiporter, APA family